MNIKSYLFYLIVYSISSILIYLAQWSKSNKKTFVHKDSCFKIIRQEVIFLTISFSLAFFISGWRNGIGTDFFRYQTNYQYITSSKSILYGSRDLGIEPGFVIINHIVKYIFNDVQYVFIVSSFITLLFIYMAIWGLKEKINTGMALFTYLLLFHNISFNAVRQFIAISIIIYSFKYISKRDLSKYILFVLIASSFHYSAIMMLPLYFLFGDTKIQKINKLFAFIWIVFILIFLNDLIGNIDKLLLPFGYSDYLQANFSNEIKIGAIIERLPFILVIFACKNKVVKYDMNSSIYIDAIFFEAVLSLFAYKIQYFSRALVYLEIFKIFLIPVVLKSFKRDNSRFIIYYLAFGYIFVYWIIHMSIGVLSDSIPYSNVFGWGF